MHSMLWRGPHGCIGASWQGQSGFRCSDDDFRRLCCISWLLHGWRLLSCSSRGRLRRVVALCRCPVIQPQNNPSQSLRQLL